MKRNRMTAVFVAFVLLLSCFTAVQADDAKTAWTEEELLAGTVKVHGFDFTAMEESALPTTLNNAAATKDGGMRLTLTSTYGYANLTGFTNPLSNGNVLKYSFVMPEAGNLESEIVNNGKRMRLYTYNGALGVNDARGGSLTTGKTYSVILKQTGDTVSAYMKASDETTYSEIFADAALTDNTGSAIFRLGFAGAAGNSMIFHEVTQYASLGESFTEAAIVNGTPLGKGYDFTSMTQEQINAVIETSNAAVTKVDGGVQLTTNTASGFMRLNSGIYTFEEGSVLKVTYIQPTTGVLSMNMYDGTNRYRMHTYNNKFRFNHWAEAAYPTVEAGKEYTLMVKKSNGTFSYYLKDGEYFYKILSDIACDLTDTTTAQFRLSAEGENASIVFKSIEQYTTGGTGGEPEEKDSYTEAEILDNTALYEKLDFSKMTAAELETYQSSTNTQVSLTNDGLVIPEGAYNYFSPNCFEYSLGEAGAVKVTFMMTGMANIEMEVASKNSSERIRFFTISSGLLGYNANDGSANITDYTEEILACDTWYTYIIKKNAGKIAYYKQNADNTYAKVAEYTPATVTSNSFSLGATGTDDGNGSVIYKEVSQYLTPEPDDPSMDLESLPVLTDKDEIAATVNETIFYESFDSQSDAWTLTNSEIKNGVLAINPGKTAGNASAIISAGNFDLSGPYQVRFKVKLNQGYSEIIFSKDGLRVPCIFWENQMRIGANVDENIKAISTRRGIWYDVILNYRADGKVDAYRKESSGNNWKILYQNLTLDQGSGSDYAFYGGGNTQRSIEIDDLRVFKGMSVDTTAYAVSEGNLTTGVSVAYGTPESTHNRRVSVLAVAYDKTYGYTRKVWEDNILAVAADGGHGDFSFDVSSVDLNDNHLSVLFLDSGDTVYPLADAQGYCPPNLAGDVSGNGQSVGVTYQTDFNEVCVSGYAGRVCDVVVAVLDGTDVKAIAQIPTGKYGMFDTKVAVDPTLPSGDYTLRVAYGNKIEDYPISLTCGDKGHNEISSKAEFVSYINSTNMSQEVKDYVIDDSFATDAYARFTEIQGGNSFANLYLFRDALNKAIQDEADERAFLASLNLASQNQKWDEIRTLITETYKDFLQTDLLLMSGIEDQKAMFMRMTGITYGTPEDAKAAYVAAANAQRAAQEQNVIIPSFGGAPAGGGGGGGFGGGTPGFTLDNDPNAENGEKTEVPVTNKTGYELKEDFPDIADVEWAVDSILDLYRRNFIDGDENGNFNPHRDITREEFLKIIMNAAGISADHQGDLRFSDVDGTAWYFPYVNSAYQKGIIKGISDTQFGIGDSITRADMAVMIKRILEYCGIYAKGVEAANVFDDFDKIPEYARDSVFFLYEAGLMKGVGDNLFAPDRTATRAEAAVAIHRIYQYINERR